jgi:hypothetical protein
MKNIKVKSHVLYRWPERIDDKIDVRNLEHYIEQMFKNNRYLVLEPAKRGRLIVKIKDYVFVISKSNSTLVIHTVYGKFENYTLKRPHAVDDFAQVALDKWERHQYIFKTRGSRKG